MQIPLCEINYCGLIAKMAISNFLLCIFWCFICQTVSMKKDDMSEYLARCNFSTKSSAVIPLCHVSLFTNYAFDLGAGFLLAQNDLCDSSNPVISKNPKLRFALGVQRGNCSFEEKSRTAIKMGAVALVIFNQEPSFPVGASTADYVSPIPVIMIQSRENIDRVCNGSIFSVSYVPKAAPQTNNQKETILSSKGTIEWINSIFIAIRSLVFPLFVVVLIEPVRCAFSSNSVKYRYAATAGSKLQANTITSRAVCTLWRNFLFILSFALLSLLFVAMRLGTYRVIGTTASGVVEYNHRETDEMIFQKLMEYVSRNLTDYTLRDKPIIAQYNLAPENYSDPVFIHPPLFVYLSTLLHYMMGLSVPTISIVYQMVGLWCVPVICYYLYCNHSYSSSESGNSYMVMSLYAMVVLVFCPLAVFCAHKFWIDNCLLMCVTVCAAGHMTLTNASTANTNNRNIIATSCVVPTQYIRYFLSGFVLFGGIAMHCKITALGMLPFLVVWGMLQRFIAHNSLIKYNSSGSSNAVNILKSGLFWRDCAKHTVMFIIGAVLAYSPWLYTYHHYTGRFIPNAWPSETMLKNSAFVRAAVNKPSYFYFQVLMEFSPCHLLGVLLAILLGCKALREMVVWCSSRSSDNNTLMQHKKYDDTTYSDMYNVDGNYNHVATKSTTSRTDVVYFHLKLLVFSLWPASYLFCLTVLGCNGAGFQSRFLSPVLPATAILSASAVHIVSEFYHNLKNIRNSSDDEAYLGRLVVSVSQLLFALCLLYSAIHAFYYGVLYAPMFAELDHSLRSILSGILTSPAHSPATRESFEETLKFMAHYGLNRLQK